MAQDPVTPARLLQLGQGFMASRTLLSAVELGVFTTLAAGPADAASLRAKLGLHPRSARDFLDALVALGLLQRDEAGRYANTPETDRYLDRAKPGYIGGLFEMMSLRVYRFWDSLTEALRTGRPQNEAKDGDDLFASLYADPSRLESFLSAMTGISTSLAQALVEAFPWHEVATVIDVGAAQGCVPVQLALAHPHLTGGGFDLPQVEAIFRRYVAAHGLADRLRFHAGDFFRDTLPQADVLVMGHVLHDWDLTTKRLLLAKAHAALPAGGALIVYDMLIDEARRENAAGLLMSLNMLIETPGGFDYTGTDCVGWMRDVGFGETKVVPLAGPHSAVIGRK
jgi:hypothetical protein